MALASESDVEAALGRSLVEGEDVSHLLETASDRVVGYLGYVPGALGSLTHPVPDPVKRVVADMVKAVLDKPAVTTSAYQASGYNVQREAATVTVGVESVTTTGPWISSSQKLALRPFLRAKSRRVFSIDLAPNATSAVTNIVAWDNE
jgi:hypothetical protein